MGLFLPATLVLAALRLGPGAADCLFRTFASGVVTESKRVTCGNNRVAVTE
jgi:hypothetical protein